MPTLIEVDCYYETTWSRRFGANDVSPAQPETVVIEKGSIVRVIEISFKKDSWLGSGYYAFFELPGRFNYFVLSDKISRSKSLPIWLKPLHPLKALATASL